MPRLPNFLHLKDRVTFEIMEESISLYLNLRSKQIVRVLAGIGPFRCLFLISIAAILFYAFTKVTSVWVLSVCYLLMLWLYHNSRKDKGFLSLQVHGIKGLFTAEYLLLGLPYYFGDNCCKLHFFTGYHTDCGSYAVDSPCQVSFYSSAYTLIMQWGFAV